ncbi:MAG: hypothetical protein ACREJ4_14950, partial [Candidatus Methylomirabilaceae bacterium]
DGLIDIALDTGKCVLTQSKLPAPRRAAIVGLTGTAGGAIRAATEQVTTDAVSEAATRVAVKQATARVASRMATGTAADLGETVAEGIAHVAAKRTSIQVLSKMAGSVAASVAACPLVEVARLALDEHEHAGGEYAAVAGRGLAAGVAGGSVTAIFAFLGSVIPGIGTVIGWGAGTLASWGVNWLLET